MIESTLAQPLPLTVKTPVPPGGGKVLDIETAKQYARSQAEEFESVFLNTFVEQMFSGIETKGPFTGGSSEKIYRSMMSQEYAKSIAKTGGIGLADHVYNEILKAQHIEP